MKIRSGFVSNSSSSSFVLLGFEINPGNKNWEELYDMAETMTTETGHDVRIYHGDEDGMPQGVTACGILLGYALEESRTQITPIQEAVRQIEDLQKRFGQGGEIKVWAGTRMS